jgi:hypothetical protein
MVPFLATRDNETLLVSVLMHKFRAFSMLKRTTVTLSELGIRTHATLLPDVSVEIPRDFRVEKVPYTITKDNYAEFVKWVRADDRRAVAYVNTPTAPFADSFAFPPNFNFLLQDKQRVEARLRRAEGRCVAKVGEDELRYEYSLLGEAATAERHAFLYVTDEDSPSRGARIKNACIVPQGDHKRLFGEMCAYLRSAALGWSAIDTKTPA